MSTSTRPMPPLPAEATAPKINGLNAPWLPEQKAHKVYWLAQLRQLNYSPEEISPLIQVGVSTLYRWLNEPEGLAIEDMVAEDSWAALRDKHNLHRQVILNERAEEWARVDAYIRHSQDFTSPEYMRAVRVRRMVELDLHRLTGGRWYPPLLRGKLAREVNALKDSLPGPRQTLPNYCDYINAQDALKEDMAQANALGVSPEGWEAPAMPQRIPAPDDGAETLAPPLRRLPGMPARSRTLPVSADEADSLRQHLERQWALAETSEQPAAVAGSHESSHANSHGNSRGNLPPGKVA